MVRWLAYAASVFGVLAARMLVPTPIGFADNGDGPRLMCHLGLWQRTGYFNYVPFRYDVDRATCAAEAELYTTTQSWLLPPARFLTGVLGLPGELNLIALAVLHLAILAALVAVVVVAVPASAGARVVLASALTLLVGDAAFAGYWASPYSEPAALIGLLGVVAGILVGARRWAAGLALLTVAGIVLVGAKTQTVPLALAVAPVLVLAAFGGPRRWTRYALASSAAVAVLAAGGFFAAAHRSDLGPINAYDTIFANIVDGEHDTAGDLAALGLPQSFARYAGKSYWDTPTAHQDPLYVQYAHRITFTTIAEYYATHPGRVVEIAHRGARDMLSARSDYLGSYPADAGHRPRATEHRFDLLSRSVSLLSPGGLFLLVPTWILLGWLAVRAVRAPADSWRRTVGTAQLFLLACTLCQFAVAVYAEGIENTKHLIIALFSLLLGYLLAIAYRTTGRPPPVELSGSIRSNGVAGLRRGAVGSSPGTPTKRRS